MAELQIKPTQSVLAIHGVAHPSPFQCDIEVLAHQTSTEVDHVNNIEYLKWIDKAAQLHCDSLGWTRNALLSEGVMWFVGRHEIDYRAEATSQDDLLLTTWVDDVRRVKSWRTAQIHSLGTTPRIVCQCKTLWVLVDLETRRPTPIPTEMAFSLESLKTPRLAE
ncbi:MAG: thioesterase family protein [Planctomycetes bacterium]|nr:thioesterase family protein [Planctomycetota bacterium]